jgi:hypothetical protein
VSLHDVQDLFSLAVVLYEIFTKTITAATVIVMGTPHECSDYAYKVHPCGASLPLTASLPRNDPTTLKC